MGLELEIPRELRETAVPMSLGAREPWQSLLGLVFPSCPAGLGHSFLQVAIHPPSPATQPGGTHLSHSGVGVSHLAQICLSTQKSGQLGLGQQVLQVVGSSNVQLGQGQADSPVEMTPLGAWGAPTH